MLLLKSYIWVRGRNKWLASSMVLLALVASVGASRRQVLPQGWRITPVGKHTPLMGDFPARILLSPDGSQLVVLTSGFHHQGVTIIDARSEKIVSSTNLGKAYGDMALDVRSKRLFVCGGGAVDDAKLKQRLASRGEQIAAPQFDAAVLSASLDEGKLSFAAPIGIEHLAARDRFISGIAIGKDGALFVVNINNDTVYRLSPPNYKVEASAASGYGAYRAAVSPDGMLLAVSNWGDESISLFSTAGLALVDRVKVGVHPNDLVFGPDRRLFVSNAGSNSVSVIRQNKLVETIKTSLTPSDPVGSTPDAVAVSRDGTRLFVANADNNDVAVIDISRPDHSQVLGFIPTGWHPSALAVSREGKTLYVGIAKGLASRANVPTSKLAREAEPDPRHPYDYVGDTLTGYVSFINTPTKTRLKQLTEKVVHNFPSAESDSKAKAIAETIQNHVFPQLKHVLYIIRENRTYDQVLGDLGRGNGDPSLTLFGEAVTPNAHKLARTWAVFDNLYVNGEVSENGHQWSDAAYATDFISKGWLQSYSGRGEPKAGDGELGADERLRSSPGGYLWDNCALHGVSFRTYGEFAFFHSGRDQGPRFVAKGLEGHASVDWLKLASTNWTNISKGRDPDLADVFIREMHDSERRDNWPRFMVMSLGEDHTHALRPGHYTPSAMVASNDQALGKIIDAVSHSRFWPETIIFVIEDDAQDGPDHVDCRRTVGLTISPYLKRGIVDSTLYTTASMIHTMELILGLPTMTQFDRAAIPMLHAFSTTPDFTPYSNISPQIDLLAKNPEKGPAADASLRLDFSGFDRADPEEMNRILWGALKPGVPLPAPVRSALGNGN
ncbi:MAG: phosphoesterase [Bryobacteraceae bacterium]